MNSNRVIIIAGGICSGKSYISEIIKKEGYFVFDTDYIAKKLMKPNSEVLNKLVNYFGNIILNKDNSLNRKQLGNIIYNDEEKRKFVESLVHPKVIEYIEKHSKNYSISFIETAIALRSKIANLGKIWFVYASVDDRIKRMMEQRGYSREYAYSIIKAQEDEDSIINTADEIIENGIGKNPKKQVLELLSKYENM